MNGSFYKYQGTGNDFVMVDNRQNLFPKDNIKLIEQLCDRRFGIGADGLILLETDIDFDFRMVYYNSDGNESSMCGNGGRCIVAFAKQLGIITNRTSFIAIDGMHQATIDQNGLVSLQMKNVENIKLESDYTFLNTGSPHHVLLVEDLAHYNIKQEGAKIRYSNLYGEVGSNVNFVSQVNDATFAVRTYERGVEDETLSCGTGVTAVAIAMNAIGKTNANQITLLTEGGQLQVKFQKRVSSYEDIFLIGPATFVFEGTMQITA